MKAIRTLAALVAVTIATLASAAGVCEAVRAFQQAPFPAGRDFNIVYVRWFVSLDGPSIACDHNAPAEASLCDRLVGHTSLEPLLPAALLDCFTPRQDALQWTIADLPGEAVLKQDGGRVLLLETDVAVPEARMPAIRITVAKVDARPRLSPLPMIVREPYDEPGY